MSDVLHHAQALQRAANTPGIPARALQAAIDVLTRQTANISAVSDLVSGTRGGQGMLSLQATSLPYAPCLCPLPSFPFSLPFRLVP